MKIGLKFITIVDTMYRSGLQILFVFFAIILVFIGANPMLTFLTLCIFAAGFFFIRNILIPHLDNLNYDQAKKNRREAALLRAKMYLSPYKNIWRDLKLSNKHCTLTLDKDGVTISAKEKTVPYRSFNVLHSPIHEYTDLWDMFCINFNHCKTYEDLVQDCRLYSLYIYEFSNYQINYGTVTHEVKEEKKEEEKPIILPPPKLEKLDINNCSEIELTELPGISIVMAKKAIKKRDEIGGYKTIDDFFLFLRLKPHIENQLRERICVKKMKGALKKIERNSERSVDL